MDRAPHGDGRLAALLGGAAALALWLLGVWLIFGDML
jgi:hypothetical protein